MAIINGTDAGQTLPGTTGADTINAFAGNDILIGGLGLDLLYGGNGADRFDILAQNEIVAGETYDGGLGFDQLFLNTTDMIDLSTTIITGVEHLKALGGVTLLSAQLGAFTRVEAEGITLKDGGLVDLSNSAVFNTRFNLHADGNVFTLAGTANARYEVIGGLGSDVVTGGEAGNDIDGGGGDDTLTGGASGDVLTGGSGRDIVRGGGGDDRLVIAAASDVAAGEQYIGGAGRDTLAVTTTDAVDLTGVTIAEVEALEADGSVRLTRAQLTGFRTIDADTVELADAGQLDLGNAFVGMTTFELADGNNTVTMAGVTSDGVRILGGTGYDRITGSNDPNGGDLIDGGAGIDTLSGGAGDDLLIGGLGRDFLDGGSGFDLFVVRSQAELAFGERYKGGDGYDGLQLNGTDAYDISKIVIDADVEELIFGTTVTMTAQQFGGFQRISGETVKLSTGGVVDLSTTDPFTRQVYVDTIHLSNVATELDLSGQWYDYQVFGGKAGDTIIGGDGFNEFFGGAGNDLLRGGRFGDDLYGGAGLDVLDGGAGDDIFGISAVSDLVAGERYIGGEGFDTLDLGLSTPATIDISRIIVGADVEALESNGSVRLTAAQLDGFSELSAGLLTLTTSGSIDLSDVTSLSVGAINLYGAGNTIDLGGFSGVTVNGSNGADVIKGGSGTLNGGAGNDIITGGTGSDVITGGRGNDTVDGGAGDDTLVITSQNDIMQGEIYRGGTGFDTLKLDAGSTFIRLSQADIGADIERLESTGTVLLTASQLDHFTSLQTGAITLSSAGSVDLTDADVRTSAFNLSGNGNTLDLTGQTETAFTVNGGRWADTISGGDHLDGDRLTGGGGSDILTGGAGGDSFVYTSIASGVDTITDFSGSTGQNDKLVFEGLLTGTFSYLGTGAFTGTGNSEARFVATDRLQIDTDGDGGVDMTIRMLGQTAAQLSVSDFIWA